MSIEAYDAMTYPEGFYRFLKDADFLPEDEKERAAAFYNMIHVMTTY